MGTSTITVRVTGLSHCHEGMRYHVETYDFKEYVKGALAAEWGNDWHEDSLKAGAVATKNYLYVTYLRKGYVWDCNWDVVYRPEWRTEATDQAVDDTWDWWLVDDRGNLITTYFNAWQHGCDIRGEEHCLSQWGTYYSTATWKEMLEVYDGILIRVPQPAPHKLRYLYY